MLALYSVVRLVILTSRITMYASLAYTMAHSQYRFGLLPLPPTLRPLCSLLVTHATRDSSPSRRKVTVNSNYLQLSALLGELFAP